MDVSLKPTATAFIAELCYQGNLSKRQRNGLLAASAALLCLYVGAEVGVGAFIYTYSLMVTGLSELQVLCFVFCCVIK